MPALLVILLIALSVGTYSFAKEAKTKSKRPKTNQENAASTEKSGDKAAETPAPNESDKKPEEAKSEPSGGGGW